jgi:hypothetical protein
MSTESQGFSNALLIMLSEETSSSTPMEVFSIECTPGTTPNTKNTAASKLLSQDLIRKLEDCSPVKPFIFEEEEIRKSLFSIDRAYYRYQFSAGSNNSDENFKKGKQGWHCAFCQNFNFESKFLFNI